MEVGGIAPWLLGDRRPENIAHWNVKLSVLLLLRFVRVLSHEICSDVKKRLVCSDQDQDFIFCPQGISRP